MQAALARQRKTDGDTKAEHDARGEFGAKLDCENSGHTAPVQAGTQTCRVSRRVTLSIGVAVQTADEAISPEQLQRRADAALYLAKQTGRNRVLLH